MAKINVRELLELWDDWNIPMVINDHRLGPLIKEDKIVNVIVNKYEVIVKDLPANLDLLTLDVVSFCKYDNTLCIKVDF